MRLPRLITALIAGMGSTAVEAASPEDSAFFESRIRPLLAKECYGCHSAEKKIKGGLRLDLRDGWATGGDSGPALVPGDPANSRLLVAVRYADPDLQMPPKHRLTARQIANLEEWIKRGAPDPREGTVVASPSGIDIDEGRKFWAYQAPRTTSPPEVKQADWPRGAIDRFVLRELESHQLHPAPDADRATLARRVYFHLIGLPPTPEEIDAFVGDTAPDAFEKLVDRLIASPHFGERWGRHWLDVVRYAESVTLRGLVFQEAWRYRDYVIDAFNDDLPYDRFLREQVAGDLLPAASPAEKRRQMIATTFLALGNINLEDQDKDQLRMDVVDEQLDTLGKAFLGQTLGCARCHDHKFDSIPTRDYYALAGILRNVDMVDNGNVSNWTEVPLPLEPEREAEFKEHESAVAKLEARIKKARGATKGTRAARIAVAADLPGIVIDDTAAKRIGNWTPSTYTGLFIGEGYLHDDNTGKGEKTLTFLPELPRPGRYEVRLAYTAAANRASNVPVTVFSAEGETTVAVDQRAEPPLDGRFVSLGEFRFEENGQAFVLVGTEGTDGHVIADAVQFLPLDASKAPATQVAEAPDDAAIKAEDLKRMEAELKKMTAEGPRRPRVMTVTEAKRVADIRVHIRGLVGNQGEVVPRGFLQVASTGEIPTLPENQSGRLELGDWLANPANPLTARVMVNRVWHWLFGAGLVRTVDNFGTTGEAPSHPELLDHLAVRFMEDGWSVKKLVREIILSHIWQLSSEPDEEALAADPENRLLSHMNRQRIDAEGLRDTMLAVGGRLDLTRGGPTIRPGTNADYDYAHHDVRRSVYAPVLRNSLPELFEVFDFADPSMVVGRRNASVVAPQALFLMNHPFVAEQAEHAARNALASPSDETARIHRAYRLTLGRAPTDREAVLVSAFLAEAGAEERDRLLAWTTVYKSLFASVDFRYLH